MFDKIDDVRRKAVLRLDAEQRSLLGQFMTPGATARFMASLFAKPTHGNITVLDAGAGVGSLTTAFLEQIWTGWRAVEQIQVAAYELDAHLISVLTENLAAYQNLLLASDVTMASNVRQRDFIEDAVMQLCTGNYTPFNYAILNPPYRKINSQSRHRHLLRLAGIETVNLYTAFVALAMLLLAPGGQLVAIIPRSFCNGPYYRSFRQLLFKHTAIRHLHLFKSRSKAFGEDGILQENIIIHLVKSEPQGQVRISSSSDDTFNDLKQQTFAFSQVVRPNDTEQFIHIPDTTEPLGMHLPAACNHSLAQLGVTVSTGPVVDFRVKEYLRIEPDENSVPLLYPGHFAGKHVKWPISGFRKSNAITTNSETQKWLYPSGYYTLVKRFSSKEERKRIVASVTNPQLLPGDQYGFENHLNVFHARKNGLTQELALGLAVYLNSSVVDQYFRQFNGHTQVNATDLRLLTYPDLAILNQWGEWAKSVVAFEQTEIDDQVAAIL